jgi:preprotein translocase subunit YajC
MKRILKNGVITHFDYYILLFQTFYINKINKQKKKNKNNKNYNSNFCVIDSITKKMIFYYVLAIFLIF